MFEWPLLTIKFSVYSILGSEWMTVSAQRVSKEILLLKTNP